VYHHLLKLANCRFLLSFFSTASWTKDYAANFTATRPEVEIQFIEKSFDEIYADAINEAAGQLQLYDGFVTPPAVAGSVVQYNGWADLTPYIQETAANLKDWGDILIGYRKYVAQYEGTIIMYPLDGDLINMFYRKDILAAFGLKPPRTWDEYSNVARLTHGRTFENRTLSGSCVGRVSGCAGVYWANLILSSLTQTLGPGQGHLFDTRDMTPLTGVAMEQALKWMEDQVKYGAVGG
jgi:ABC-type glycerol-3-phosphate transport system substrate-binding protein